MSAPASMAAPASLRHFAPSSTLPLTAGARSKARPAPPSARRAYGAQAYGQQQYYGNQGYAPAPQVYYQPRPNYPRQRDFYGNSYQD